MCFKNKIAWTIEEKKYLTKQIQEPMKGSNAFLLRLI